MKTERTTEYWLSTISHALVQQATDEAAMKQLKLELGAHKAHINMLSSRLEQVTADVHAQCKVYACLRVALLFFLESCLYLTWWKSPVVPSTDKNEIQDLRDVIAVEQEEKKDMHRKLQNAENECKFKLSWLAEKKGEGESFWKLHPHHEPIQTGKHDSYCQHAYVN